jgi:hypothetical protein
MVGSKGDTSVLQKMTHVEVMSHRGMTQLQQPVLHVSYTQCNAWPAAVLRLPDENATRDVV